MAPIAAVPPKQLKLVVFGDDRPFGCCTLAFEQFVILFTGWPVRFFAPCTDPLAEPGRKNAEHGVGEIERITAKVQEADHGFDGAVGMEGAEHEVAGEGRFDRDVGGFLVPHLTDHDDVRICPQKRPHGGGEIQPDLLMNLELAQPFLCNFNGVFRRPDFPLFGVDMLQNRVQQRGFPGARRTHAQEDAMRLLGQHLDGL